MCFEKLHVRINFVVLKNVLSDLLVERARLKRLGGVLDIKSEEVRTPYKEKEATLLVVSEYSQTRSLIDKTDSENFTPDFDDSEFVPDEEGKSRKLVFTVHCDDLREQTKNVRERASSWEKHVQSELANKFGHLPKRHATGI